MEKHPVKVCMISCLHGLYDDRIYWKEALSLKKHGYDVTHIGISEVEFDIITEHGIRLISIQRTRYFSNPYLDFLYKKLTFKANIYKRIFKTAKELNSDIYHFHDYQINRIVKQLKKLAHKPKVIYDAHEPYPEIERYLNHSKGLFKLIHILHSVYIDLLQKRYSGKLDAIITTEENVASYFKGFFTAEKVKIIYNYCDFDISTSADLEQKEFDLIYIGGISRWRGVFELLNTALEASKTNHPIKILLIGQIKEAGLKDTLLQIIQSENLHDWFTLKEFVPRNELIQYLTKSKIGVCIFKDNPVYHILLPIKIFEYMAFGLPTLVNNFGHTFRIISAENAGIAIDKPTPSNILKETLKILEDPGLYKTFSENAKNSVAKYTWDKMEKELWDLYLKLG